MLFNSYAFAIFFAALFPTYWLLARWPRLQNVLLLGAAYYFYSRWNARFLSFFPHLVAGPIMRPTTLLPQVASRRRFDLRQVYEGAYLIFWGLLKKVVIADNLAGIVNELFGRWQTLDGGSALLAIYAFAFQI